MQRRWVQFLTVIAACAFVISTPGCGNKSLKFNNEVNGVVTIDGTPLANIRVEFIPSTADGTVRPISYAVTNDSGAFKLTCENSKPGAVIAKHRVVILQGRGGENSHDRVDPSPDDLRVPEEYKIASKTPIEIEVTADKHDYPITVSTGRR